MHSLVLAVEYGSLIRVPLLLAAFVFLLPFISFFTPAKALFRGLFDLTPLSLAAVTLSTVAVAGTACVNASVVLMHAHDRFHIGNGPLSPPQLWWWLIIMLFLSLPVIVFSVRFSAKQRQPLSLLALAALLGAGAGFAIAAGLLVWFKMQPDAPLPPSLESLQAALAGSIAFPKMTAGYVPLRDHLRATAGFLSTLALYVIVGLIGRRQLGQQRTVPALCSLLLLIMMIGWMLSAAAFFLDAGHVPVVLIVLLAGLITAQSTRSDHFYDLKERLNKAPAPDPGATIIATGARRVIVVAANGGGIQSASWTAQVLYGLAEEIGPAFARSLRMISSVSGGSQGATYFLHWLNNPMARRPDQAAAESSLDEVAWGLAFPDFLKSLLPWIFGAFIGRGRALEIAWRTNSAENREAAGQLDLPLSTWNEKVLRGELPAIIMNSTITESGERLLLCTTGMGKGINVGRARVDSAELHTIDGKQMDVGVLTAARLSASFTYVLPAARAKAPGNQPHIVDGGYYDNYGMATLADWLDTALTDSGGHIDSVLVIQIRGTKINPDLRDLRYQKNRGWFFQALAPILALVAVRGAAQLAHNNIELDLLQEKWAGSIPIQSVTFEFPDEQAPLSWHLTPTEADALRDAWETNRISFAAQVKKFLVP